VSRKCLGGVSEVSRKRLPHHRRVVLEVDLGGDLQRPHLGEVRAGELRDRGVVEAARLGSV